MNDDGSARARREVRWFIDGDVSPDLRPDGEPRRRVDAYDLATLRPYSAVKRRGARRVLEHKVRVGLVERYDVGDVVGFAEVWRKVATGQRGRSSGQWLDVHKQLWTCREVEIGVVRVGDQESWTLCVDLDRPRSRAGGDLVERWRPLLRRRSESCSYPAWIGRLRGADRTTSRGLLRLRRRR